MKKVIPKMVSMENQKSFSLNDPRVTADRYPMEFSASDIDQISEITGGKCSVVIYKREHNDVALHVFPHISCEEVEVVSKKLPKAIVMLVNEVQNSTTISIQDMCSQLMEHLMERKETAVIPELTIGQTTNKLWFECRYGRISTS